MHNLPPQLTVFIGRTEEIAEISHLIENPDCRLLTVAGVGGIGKTRLAIQAAAQMGDAFTDGVYLIALQPVAATQFIVSTIADAISFPLVGNQDPEVQLLQHLCDKQMLLVMDNFEHLLDGVRLLTTILEAAPQVKLLVTSRETLHLQEEWLYPIEGLDYPKASTNPLGDAKLDATAYSAMQLFAERARHMRRGFSLSDELVDVAAICQIVEGMPLALELAAAWTQTMSCRAIAAEIQRDLDFLATEWRNVPDRQRSMRAVFAHSRHMLTPTEQEVFKRLSIFRGGFRREAAEVVVGATLSVLNSLVSRSLLRWETAGRYAVHELLRQYADEILSASAEEKTAICDQHCAYYTDFLYKRLPDLIGGKQLEALVVIEAEIENIRVAWHYAVEQRKIEEIGRAVQVYLLLYVYRSRPLEGLAIFEQAIQQLGIFEATDPRERLLAIRFQELAWFYVRMGRLDEAQAIQERIQFFYDQLEIAPIEGSSTDPLFIGAILAVVRGEYQTALRLGHEALQKSYQSPHLSNRQYAQYALAGANLALGDYASAQHYAEAAQATAMETQDRWFLAYCLIELGNIAFAMGDNAAARQYWEASYARRKEFNDPEGMAIALNYLGEVALQQGQVVEARELFEESVALYREINDRGGLARALNGLGNAVCATGDYAAARQHLQESLQIAAEIHFVQLIFSILCSIGNLLLRTGKPAPGLTLLACASRHPSSTTQCKTRAQTLLAHYRPLVKKELYDRVIAQEQTQEQTQDSIEEVKRLVAMAQRELDAPVQASPLPQPTQREQNPPPTQPLVEPLTAREIEILTLIADGLSNQEIASHLFITRGTVKWYTSQIYGKLGIVSRTQAIGRAKALSLLP
ncbi:MAG: tetratricopeptide repeat protein [Caldilineaceae bacterium]|nr:tetratricopeptide repeat protein [Caldilineaceae bacterium]